MSTFPSINKLLNQVVLNKQRKIIVSRVGKSHKASICIEAINKLNAENNTSFYLDREGKTFTIQGHRENGTISLRSGVLGENIDMTLGGNEIPKAGVANTIKMIIDSTNNYIVISLIKMQEHGLLDNLSDHDQKCVKFSDNRFFYTWCFDELDKIGAILYKSY